VPPVQPPPNPDRSFDLTRPFKTITVIVLALTFDLARRT
jgi:hypothetical protein